jgi:hypothetical protein
LELVGALFWALHVALLGKFASRFEAMSFSVGQLLVCGILNLVPGMFVEGPIFTWPLAGAAVYTLSCRWEYIRYKSGLKASPPSDAALILSLESVLLCWQAGCSSGTIGGSAIFRLYINFHCSGVITI